jgi:hypothetical protein
MKTTFYILIDYDKVVNYDNLISYYESTDNWMIIYLKKIIAFWDSHEADIKEI